MVVNGYVEMISELGCSGWERIAEFKYFDEATRYALACATAPDACGHARGFFNAVITEG